MRNKLIFLGLLVASQAAWARDSLDVTQYGIVYRLPGMDRVKVRKDLPFGNGLKLDLYLPANHRASRPVPVVVFVNGVGDPPGNELRSWRIYQDWGRLVAAHGYAGIVAQAPPASVRESVAALFEHVASEGAKLGLDPARVAAWSCSANVAVALPYLMGEPPRGVRAAVVYYGNAAVKTIRTDLPVFSVLAGKDGPQLIEGERALWKQAVAARARWTMVEEPELPHAFDAVDSGEESRRVVQMTLAFLDAHLGPLPAPPPPSKGREMLSYVYGQENDKAAKILEEYVRADPRDTDAWFRLAMVRKNLGQNAEAEKGYNQVLALQPDHAGAVRWLGIMKAQAGDCAGAEPMLDRAVKLGQTDGFVLSSIGGCQLRRGRAEDAVATFEKAIASGARAPFVYYNLACAQVKAGKTDAAFASLDSAVELGFNDRKGLEEDLDLAPLRGDPRWKKLVEKVAPR